MCREVCVKVYNKMFFLTLFNFETFQLSIKFFQSCVVLHCTLLAHHYGPHHSFMCGAILYALLARH